MHGIRIKTFRYILLLYFSKSPRCDDYIRTIKYLSNKTLLELLYITRFIASVYDTISPLQDYQYNLRSLT
jgi:hypothetical protein